MSMIDLDLAVHLVAALLVLAVTTYAILAGADFGAGIWEANTALLASPRERRLLQRAIGPVWEVNHVWLIFALVVAFTCFPATFAHLMRALFWPLSLALVGIVTRGAAFVLQVYGTEDPVKTGPWTFVFAAGSTMAPFFLGLAAFAIGTGALPDPLPPDRPTPWLTASSLFGGFYYVVLCTYLCAVLMAREARDDATLEPVWRQRALATGVWTGILSLSGLVFLHLDAPALGAHLTRSSSGLILASMIGGLGSLVALAWRRHALAVMGSGVAVAAVLLGCAVAQYPMLVPPDHALLDRAAPPGTLRFVLAVVPVGLLILVPSLVLLFALFKSDAGEAPDRSGSAETTGTPTTDR